MKFDYNKILEARKNRKQRKSDPFSIFSERYFLIIDLLDKIHKKVRNKYLLQEAKNQTIIAIVSAFEIYFKDLVLSLLEKKLIKEEDVIDKEDKINLFDLKEILKNKMTIAELIVWQYDFGNLFGIQRFFSNGFNLDFISELKKTAFRIRKKGSWLSFTQIPIENKINDDLYLDNDFYGNIQRVLNIRNNIVHDFNPKFNLTKREVNGLTGNILDFILFVDIYLSEYLIPKKKKEIR